MRLSMTVFAPLTRRRFWRPSMRLFCALKDHNVGFGDVSPRAIRTHLKTEYDTMTSKE